MMQRAQGPQRQYVLVYHVPDADRQKEAGNRRMWSDPVKVKHWEDRLATDTHIFFEESTFLDWSAYKASHSVGRRETLKGPAIPYLTQPTIFVTQDAFFALRMDCPSLDITVKYPVSRHPLPDPSSRTPEDYEATGYRLVRIFCHRTRWTSFVRSFLRRLPAWSPRPWLISLGTSSCLLRVWLIESVSGSWDLCSVCKIRSDTSR